MDLIDILKAQNEWWKTGTVPGVLFKETKREEFDRAMKFIDDRRITAIIGPRRTGKTTLIYQLIDHLLKRNVKSENILFFSIDDPALRPYLESLFEDIFKAYFEDILVRPRRKEKVYIFIDEIHFYDGWERWLKKYHDLGYPIKFVVSGSSATHLSRKSQESRVGRISEIILLPLNFKSYLSLLGEDEILKHYNKLDITSIKTEKRFELLKYEEELKILFNKYMLFGGFPESLVEKEILIWHEKMISDVLRKVLYRDLVELYNIRTPSKLEDLFVHIIYNTGQTFSFSSISRNLGISIESVINYINYLQDAYLLGELRLFSKSIEKTIRTNRKYFIMDCGLLNAITKTVNLTEINLGPLVESIIQKHVFVFAKMFNFNVYYWRDREEVDIILDTGNEITPVEVKYKNDISMKDLKGLMKFMEKFEVDEGFVITKDILGKKEMNGKTIDYIPAFLFLLGV